MKAVLIYNPVAGQRNPYGDLEKAMAFLREHSWQVTLQKTQGIGHAIQLARQAAHQGADVVVAVGGDGTIGEVATGLVGTSTRMGILPVGTGNVFAHMLGLPIWSPMYPSALLDAARVLVAGECRAIDVGQVGERFFVLWAGIGFDAQVAQEVEIHRDIRRTLGNLTYVVAAVVQAFLMRGTRMTIVVDGHALRCRVLLILVSNAQLYGPFLRVAPQAKLDDGLLDVAVFRGENLLDIIRHFGALLVGRHETGSRIEVFRGSRIQILGNKALPVHADGDPIGTTPVTIQVMPRAVNLIIPRWAPSSLFQSGGEARASEVTLQARLRRRLRAERHHWHSEGMWLLKWLGTHSRKDREE